MANEKNDADLWEERPLLFVHGQAEGGRLMTAGEVARLTDVSARTLQHYDDIGLLCPRRSGEGVANNRKLYDEGDIDRLGRIIALKEYGLTLMTPLSWRCSTRSWPLCAGRRPSCATSSCSRACCP